MGALSIIHQGGKYLAVFPQIPQNEECFFRNFMGALPKT